VAAIIASMPDETRSDETRSDQASDTPAEAEPKVSRQVQQVPTPTPRWLPLATLLLAVVAVALSTWALTSALSNSSGNSSANGKLPGDPKARVCSAFDTVARGVQLNTNMDLGPDPVAQVAVAGNARLALIGGGQYLLNQIDGATPRELADPVRSFAQQLQAIGMFALAGVPNNEPQQATRMTEADVTRKQIFDACK
jgi:hypothetical protein